MARKRLSFSLGDGPAEGFVEGPSAAPLPQAPGPAPIARVAGEASAVAALEELAGSVARARAEGRMIEALPLDSIRADHLVRDRIALDDEDMAALVLSLRTHGQRVPVEVVDLGTGSAAEGAFGLISGWRRLTALRRLAAETGEARFGTVLAVRRRPEASGAAYVAMVEENEIRAGLSYYERARIAARAVEAGAFATRTEALRALYAGASRAKRSKIGSFLTLVDALDEGLRFPAAIPERLGLALAARLEAPDFAAKLAAGLAAHPAATAEEEARRLTEALKPAKPAAAPDAEVVPGIRLATGRGGAITLSGPKVDGAFRARLEAWLRGR